MGQHKKSRVSKAPTCKKRRNLNVSFTYLGIRIFIIYESRAEKEVKAVYFDHIRVARN